jgi:hypothetical protein
MHSFYLRRLCALGLLLPIVCASVAAGQYVSSHAGAELFGPPPLASSEFVQAEGVVAPVTSVVPAGAAYPASPIEPWPAPDWSAGPSCDLCPACEECPRHGLIAFVGYDSWKGIAESGWSNYGIHTGLNFGTPLGRFSDWSGIGFQIGGSMGVYNFTGTDYHETHNDEATPQGFVTYGFFRKANDESRWTGAVVQDWMLSSNFGIFAQNPTLSQWRGQLGYVLGPWNELGVWAAWRGQGDTRFVPGEGLATWQAVQQVSVYWHYKWDEGGPDSWVWLGVPENDRLAGDGSLGDYYVGALTNCPLNDRISLYALITYMHPSARPGPEGGIEEAWNLSIGLSWTFGRRARTSTVAGQCWMPQMPVANNGYFMLDTDLLD